MTDGPELTITRTLAARRADVFAAWTDPSRVARWWGPRGFAATVAEWRAEPGGAWRTSITGPDGTSYDAHGSFHEVVPPERIVLSFVWDEATAVDSVITVTFDEDAGGTRMTFHQAPFPSLAERDSHADGWTECFERLTAYVDRSVA